MVNDTKFRELILFICHRSEGDKPFGATKLNKLLFYADFLAFQKLGKSITGHRYQRLRNGPAPRALVPVLREMKAHGFVATAEHNYYGRQQKRTVALRDAQLADFSADEVALVTEIIDDCWGRSATEMSNMSHRFRGWKLAEDGEDIPYEVATVRFLPLTGDELRALTPQQVAEITSLAADAR